ncbi:hypothetical protein AVEN_145881-1 [Araneus ventricosus]|uniref:Uncharacterized protein n=1 Tax=Araneus ventricosus TaxID=182803 RepID=A0A4Y2IHB6_ARAVE|nr:hypothetical protein AVEN_145881-1 [Araneus ventricosus]
MTAVGWKTPPIARQMSLPDCWIQRQRMAMHVMRQAETQMSACRHSRRPAIPGARDTQRAGIGSGDEHPARRMRRSLPRKPRGRTRLVPTEAQQFCCFIRN